MLFCARVNLDSASILRFIGENQRSSEIFFGRQRGIGDRQLFFIAAGLLCLQFDEAHVSRRHVAGLGDGREGAMERSRSMELVERGNLGHGGWKRAKTVDRWRVRG